jgi:hypothetical protein
MKNRNIFSPCSAVHRGHQLVNLGALIQPHFRGVIHCRSDFCRLHPCTRNELGYTLYEELFSGIEGWTFFLSHVVWLLADYVRGEVDDCTEPRQQCREKTRWKLSRSRTRIPIPASIKTLFPIFSHYNSTAPFRTECT